MTNHTHPASEPGSLHFLRSDAADPPVTVVREIRVRPGAEGRFELLMGALIDEARRRPGHLGATVIRPVGRGGTYRFVYKFDRRSNMTEWHASDTRRQLFEPILELIHDDRFDEFPGLETWFDPPANTAPPRWKTTLLSWGAIYVLVLASSYAMRAAAPDWSLPVQVFVVTAVVVPIVAYIAAPWLGKVFHRWLHAGLNGGGPKPPGQP